jgi:hypothetical protein
MLDSLCCLNGWKRLRFDFRAYKGESEPPKASKPVNSVVVKDGNVVSKSAYDKKSNTQTQQSYSTPYQLSQQKYMESQIPTIQQRLFNPTKEMQDSWQSIAQANKDLQMKNYNEDFGKAQDTLLSTISKRNLMGSSAVPYLTNELAKVGSNQLDSINKQYIADQQNARNQDYNYNSGLYNLLNGGLGQQLDIGNIDIGTALSGGNNINNFNNSQYQAAMNQYLQQLQGQGSNNSALIGGGSAIAGSGIIAAAML